MRYLLRETYKLGDLHKRGSIGVSKMMPYSSSDFRCGENTYLKGSLALGYQLSFPSLFTPLSLLSDHPWLATPNHEVSVNYHGVVATRNR